MNQLCGKSILIGRHPQSGQFCLSVDGKVATLAKLGPVPTSVSRCQPAQGTAHARIDVAADDGLTVVNLKPAGVTHVDGLQVQTKRLLPTAQLTLGMDRYPVRLDLVLQAAAKLLPRQADISGLATVWQDYHDLTIGLRKRQQRLGLLSSAGMLFTLGGGALMALSHKLGFEGFIGAVMPLLTVLGAIVFIVGFYLRSRDRSIEQSDKATQDFQERYVCPACGKFLGNQSYTLLKKMTDMKCPFCSATFVETSPQ